MDNKFYCNICNYSTDKHFNFNKHLTTKKHIDKQLLLSSKNEDRSSKNEDRSSKNEDKSSTKCIYCNKLIQNFKNKARHNKTCKIKKIKSELEYQFNKEKEELEAKHNKETSELKQNYKEMETEYFDLLKKIAKNEVGNNMINSNNNNNTLNMYYVINNFNDAINYNDIMSEPMTAEEHDHLINNGPLSSCLRIILNRCIEDIELEKRPFHCVDESRQKILLRNNNEWNIDNRAKKIIDKGYDLIAKEWKITNVDDDPHKHVDDSRKLASIKIDKNISKIISEKSSLKNKQTAIQNQ